MPDGNGSERVPAAELTRQTADILIAHGAGADAARIQAAHLVEAELRGHPSHGVRRLATLVARIDAGLVDPVAQPRLDWAAEGTLRVDGERGFGPVAGFRAVDALLDRLPRTGIAVAAMRNTHHLGMLAPYVERLAAGGAVGIVLSSTEGLVHPWGGAGALLGTNPLSIGVDSARGALTLDMSTGAVSAGKILDYRAKGLELPEGWAVDTAGAPTRDAAAAADGAISPFGGAKGYALGIALGAMVGALTDTAFGDEVWGTLDAEHDTTKGDVIIAMGAKTLAGADTRERLGDYLERVRESGPGVTVPGDRAREARSASMSEGIVLPRDIRDALDALERAGAR